MAGTLVRYAGTIPLPTQAYLPGSRMERPRLPETRDALGQDWQRCESYLYGVDLWNHGFPWEAHEAWEGPWRLAHGDRRELLQGLIQCAAARVKRAVGQGDGVATLLTRGLERLSSIDTPVCMGIAVAPLRERIASSFATRAAAPTIELSFTAR